MGQRSNHFILITSSNFPGGGPGANYLNLFCRGLKSNGANVSVCLLKGYAFGDSHYRGPRKNVSPEGIPYSYLGLKQRPDCLLLKPIDLLISLIRLFGVLIKLSFKLKKVTILLYNSDIFFNLPIYATAKLSRIRLIKFSAEIIDPSQYRKSLLGKISRASHLINSKLLSKMPDKMIVFSYYLKNEFMKRGFAEDKILVQPNLTDFSFWQPMDIEKKYTIGYSGAPYMKDGLNDLIKAMGLLVNKGRDISLVIVGDATFGWTLIPALKEECVSLGLLDRVTFTGLVSIEKVKMYLSQCCLLAVTRPDTVQTRSGFPTKLGEYFAMKKPVLATRFGDMEKYFTNEVDIVFAECGDPASIADRIEWIIDNGEELTKIVQRGYETSKQLLEFSTRMKRIHEFISE